MTPPAADSQQRGDTGGRLRLRATDADDLQVFATVLQDAIVPLTDVAWLPDENRFAMVANRFLWKEAAGSVQPEGGPGDAADYLRVNCGVVFEKVAGVQSRGLDLTQRGRMLDLLTIGFDPDEGGGAGGMIGLTFSDSADVRLKVTAIEARLEDLGEPWPTKWRPRHADDGSDGAPDGATGH